MFPVHIFLWMYTYFLAHISLGIYHMFSISDICFPLYIASYYDLGISHHYKTAQLCKISNLKMNNNNNNNNEVSHPLFENLSNTSHLKISNNAHVSYKIHSIEVINIVFQCVGVKKTSRRIIFIV